MKAMTLIDRDGKEIHEGDIIKHSINGHEQSRPFLTQKRTVTREWIKNRIGKYSVFSANSSAAINIIIAMFKELGIEVKEEK